MDKIFQKILDNDLSDLDGLTVDASIPLPEYLVNEMIEATLQGNKNLTYCRVSIGEQNRMDAHLKTSLWPWPLNFKLRLFGSVDLTHSPALRAFLDNHVVLAKLGALFRALPDGIKIYDDQISVDLGIFVDSPEHKRFLDLVTAAEIRTEEGKIILDIKIRK